MIGPERGPALASAPRPRRCFLAALVGAALPAPAGWARPAGAHAIVVESEPAAGARLARPPEMVRIRFNSRIERRLSRLSLIGPDRSAVALDLEAEDGAGPDRLAAALPPLRPGAHAIRWRVLAADGHITEGTIRFIVAPDS